MAQLRLNAARQTSASRLLRKPKPKKQGGHSSATLLCPNRSSRALHNHDHILVEVVALNNTEVAYHVARLLAERTTARALSPWLRMNYRVPQQHGARRRRNSLWSVVPTGL